jgi:hypothetical protein
MLRQKNEETRIYKIIKFRTNPRRSSSSESESSTGVGTFVLTSEVGLLEAALVAGERTASLDRTWGTRPEVRTP